MKDSKKLYVSSSYRQSIKDYFNLEDSELGHWNLLQYILLNPSNDHDGVNYTSGILTYWKTIYDFYGVSQGNLISLLRGFEDRMNIPMTITEHNRLDGKCTTIEVKIPEEVIRLTSEELDIKYADKVDKVWFATNDTYSQRQRTKYLTINLERIMNSPFPKEHPAYPLIELLHSTRTQRWIQKRVTTQYDKLFDTIQSGDPAKRTETSKLRSRQILMSMSNMPFVEYRPTEKSKRIYAAGGTVMALPREARKVLFEGCFSMDIKSSQFGIVSRLWNLPKCKAFLASGASIWEEFSAYLDMPCNSDTKDKLKPILYGVLYGMGVRTTTNEKGELCGLPAWCDNHGIDKKILKHPLIEELLKERTNQRNAIKEAGGAMDAFGVWIPVSKEFIPDTKVYHETTRNSIKSILCQVVQSYELRLMLSLVEAIKDNKNLLLVGFLHDSIIIDVVNHKEKTAKYKSQLEAAFNAEANKLTGDIQLESEDF